MGIFNIQQSDKKIYSVSELNRETKTLLSNHFSTIQVEGEISNLSTPSSGHIYFSLKDSKAQIRCAMFKSQLRRVDFTPENGKQIIISAQVSLYETRGDYQLIVDKMQESGDGRLQRAFEQLKTKLLNEGLFEQSRKQDLPEIPKQIGVITSPTGAAIHDVLSVLQRRFPSIPILIYPTVVQGEEAILGISSAIETANQQKQVDVILLVRGGGSIEDLWAFNEELVARAIAQSKIPIICGIGHEVDFTIADFVADLRAPTPSAAAENAVPNQKTWLLKFQAIQLQLQQAMQRRLLFFQQSINWLRNSLQQLHPGQKLLAHAQALDNLEFRLIRAMQNTINHKQSRFKNDSYRLQRQNLEDRILRYQEQQKYLTNRLNRSMHQSLEKMQTKYITLVQTLNAVSPLATLERGYAIVSDVDGGVVISSSQQLSVDDKIKIRFSQGSIVSQVKEIKT
jgi:exodeoxyribonuclease VII large subunit